MGRDLCRIELTIKNFYVKEHIDQTALFLSFSLPRPASVQNFHSHGELQFCRQCE